MISKSADGPAPTQEEVSGMLTKIFTAKTSFESIQASYSLCDLLLSTVAHRGLIQGAFEELGGSPGSVRLTPFASPGLCTVHFDQS